MRLYQKSALCGQSFYPEGGSASGVGVTVEQRSGEVPLRGVRQDRHDGLARTQAPGQLESGEDVRACGNARKQAFLGNIIVPYVAKEDSRVVVALQDTDGKPYSVVEFEV